MAKRSQEKEQWDKVITNHTYKGEAWNFMTSEVKLSLPIKAWGKYWTEGWDIPTCWVVDSANQCWEDNGHGPSLRPVSNDKLMNDVEHYSDKCKIAAALGLPKPQPEWVKSALAAGWTPPKDFKP